MKISMENGISEKEKQKRWDDIHSRIGKREDIRKQYDGWLESDERIVAFLKECQTPILDLGCGVGIDTLHLVESGQKVVACDFSSAAIDKVKESIPEARTMQFNMKEKMPFGNELFEFIIANKFKQFIIFQNKKQNK